MPASGEPLTVAETAPIPPGWVAPIAPHQPDLPVGREPHPVDRFIAAYFAKHALAFPPPATAALLAIDTRSETCHLGICARAGLLRRNRCAPEWLCGPWRF